MSKIGRTVRDLWKFLGPMGVLQLFALLALGLVSLIPGVRNWIFKRSILPGPKRPQLTKPPDD